MSLPLSDNEASNRSGLRLVVDRERQPLPVNASGIDEAVIDGLRRIFRQLGIDAQMTDRQPERPIHDSACFTGLSVAARFAPALAPLASTGHCIYPVKGMRGVLSGMASELSTLIAGVPSPVDASAVLACARFLRALAEPGKPIVVVDQPDVVTLLADHGFADQLSVASAPDAMRAMIEGRSGAVLLAEDLAGAFAAAAVSVTGTARLACAVKGTPGALQFCGGAWADAPTDPAGVALSASLLLLAAGHHTAAEHLHNAVLRSLEDGLHTASLPLLLPYSRQLDAVELLSAIGDRLGQRPRRLTAAAYSSEPFAFRRGRRLSCVTHTP